MIGETGQQVASTTTGQEGDYGLHHLAGTKLRINAAMAGFTRTERAQALVRGANLWDVGLPVSIEFDVPIHIAGVIRDDAQHGLAFASVTAHSIFDPQRVQQVRSDTEGRFALDVYVPGQYVVYATGKEHIGAATVIEVSRGLPVDAINLVLKSSRPCR